MLEISQYLWVQAILKNHSYLKKKKKKKHGIGIKTDVQWKRKEDPEIDPCNYNHLILRNIHCGGKKAISSTNGAGKTE
jgi:hypothetical protein